MLLSTGDRLQFMQIQQKIEEQLKRVQPDSSEETDVDRGTPDGEKENSLLMDYTQLNFLFYPRHGQWGLLPPHLQQTIEHASMDEVPLHYRRWLVEYHRLNQADGSNK